MRMNMSYLADSAKKHFDNTQYGLPVKIDSFRLENVRKVDKTKEKNKMLVKVNDLRFFDN